MRTKVHYKLGKKTLCGIKVNRKSLTEDEASVTCGKCQDVIAGKKWLEKKLLDQSFKRWTSSKLTKY